MPVRSVGWFFAFSLDSERRRTVTWLCYPTLDDVAEARLDPESDQVAPPRVRRGACVDHTSLMGGERALLLDDMTCMRRKGPAPFAADPDYSIVVMFRQGLTRDVLETC